MKVAFCTLNENFCKKNIGFSGNEKPSTLILDCDGTVINSSETQKKLGNKRRIKFPKIIPSRIFQ